MIKTGTRKWWQGVCDTCGWTGDRRVSAKYAEDQLHMHVCGLHREAFNSPEQRGLSGTWLRRCVCGTTWVMYDLSEKFVCPEDRSVVA